MRFADLVGNQAAIGEARREFGLARLTIVVGPPLSGRTSFVSCMEDHFKDTLRFEYIDMEGVLDVKVALKAACTRKHGVMEAYAAGVEYMPDTRGLRVVLDNVDASERNLVPLVEETLESAERRVGIVMVTDLPGLRKLSILKKRGALTLHVTAPGKDAVVRWARRTLLTESGDEDEHAKMRAMLRVCKHSIYRLKKAYAEGLTVEQAAEDASADEPRDQDNATVLAALFSSPLDFDWLDRVVNCDGGSMLSQLAWHNAPVVMDEPSYVEAFAASMHGMVIERGAHLKHEFSTCALGHVLSLAPYAGTSSRVDKTCMTYTTTMAQGGARAVARRALTMKTDDKSVSETAWNACVCPEPKKRRGRAPKAKAT